MKIKIETNKEEYNAGKDMIKSMMTLSGIEKESENEESVEPEVEEIDEDYEPISVELKFGKVVVNKKENYIEIEMKTDFIKDYIGVISFFMNKYKKFVMKWLLPDDFMSEEADDSSDISMEEVLKKEEMRAEEAINPF